MHHSRDVTLSRDAQIVSIYCTVKAWLTRQADVRTDGQNHDSNSVRLTTCAKNSNTLGENMENIMGPFHTPGTHMGGAPIGAGGHDPPLLEAKATVGHNLGIIHISHI